MAWKLPKEGTATIQKNATQKITQFQVEVLRGQYDSSKISYTMIDQIYNGAHLVYKRKMETFMKKNPLKEVLQQYISLQSLDKVIFMSKQQLQVKNQIQDRFVYKILDLYQICTLDCLYFTYPLGFLAKHESTRVDLRSIVANLQND